ncbi:MAG: hypothetical protein J07HX64_01609 [halophilic archaeon J07HX64]|nr:MAG: hypothetical protein J07HX64_01609 [halophilic archaeon J07HX64]
MGGVEFDTRSVTVDESETQDGDGTPASVAETHCLYRVSHSYGTGLCSEHCTRWM